MDSYGPQGMDENGCARWLGADHSRTAPKIRAVAERGSTGGSDAWSVSRLKASSESPQAAHSEGQSVELKIGRIEAALKVLGQEHSDARSCLEDVLKKAKAEGVSREVSSRPPDVSVAEANAGGSFGGMFGSSGPRRRRRTASLRGGIVEGPGSRDSGACGAAVGRVREILRARGEASRLKKQWPKH